VHRAAEAAVFDVAVDGLLPVAGLALGDQVADCGDRFRAHHQAYLYLAGGDGVGELVDQVLRTLAADHLPDGALRGRPAALGDRPREVVRGAEGLDGARARALELADRGDAVDGGPEISRPGVGDRRARRRAGEVSRRQRLVVRRVDALGRLADADDHRSVV